MCGYVPLPLTGRDYLELLPVRWHRITERGIRIDHRTYDHEVLDPVRGQSSGVGGRQGGWEVRHNPHDGRQIWVRMPDGHLAEVPWIHRDHVHRPFGDHIRRQVRAVVRQCGDHEQHEAELADALDQLMRRTRNTAGTLRKKRAAGAPSRPPDTAAVLPGLATGLPAPGWPDDVYGNGNGTGMPSGVAPGGRPGATSEPAEAAQAWGAGSFSDWEWGDSLDALAHTDPGGENADESEEANGQGRDEDVGRSSDAPRAGFGLYDAQAEAESW
ncbi:Mu transposase C-terminal domain-containing protein [Embleya sp. NPDC005575]|uniref:Mu transposase C-terminal domain-containing protein n=1 Tax=Embleya sp. NPDC005575 TaxID=3156892 RepID=UPI0033BF21F3